MKKITTIAILYPGEMGAAIARLFSQQKVSVSNYRLITCSSGRSHQTCQRVFTLGIEDLPSLPDVVMAADMIISLVPPAQAVLIAEQVSHCAAANRRADNLIYLELNSISPQRLKNIQSIFTDSAIEIVDGALHGLAVNLATQGVMYLSGAKAAQVQAVFGNSISCYLLGDEVGKASALKMLSGGLNKGLAALVFELLLAAQHAGLSTEVMAIYRQQYPQIWQVIERIAPSYPIHIGRRVDELKEMQETFEQWSGHSEVISGAGKIMQHLYQQQQLNQDGSLLLSLLQQAELVNLPANEPLTQGDEHDSNF